MPSSSSLIRHLPLTQLLCLRRQQILSIAQAELTARLQHMQSAVRGNPSPSLSVSSKAKATPAPQSSASSKHSVSHDTHSNQDIEMDSASHGSHGPSHKQAPDSFKESGHDAKGVNPLADGHDRLPHGSSRRSPSPFSRDRASPSSWAPYLLGMVSVRGQRMGFLLGMALVPEYTVGCHVKMMLDKGWDPQDNANSSCPASKQVLLTHMACALACFVFHKH